MKKSSSLVAIIIVFSIFFTGCTNNNDFNYLSKNKVIANIYNSKDFLEPNLINENLIVNRNTKKQIMHLFSSPIYAETKNNSYKVIDNTPTSPSDKEISTYDFSNSHNDIQSFIPSKLNSNTGITIKHDRTNMDIYLQETNAKICKSNSYTNIYGIVGKYMKFANVFGNNNYNVLMDDFGINTEIEFKNSITKIEYIIKIENVIPDQPCSDYILLKDRKNKEVKAVIYKPVISSKEKSLIDMDIENDCDMQIKQENDFTYRLTISLSDKLISKSNSKIKLNQSFHLYKPKQPDSAIYSNSNDGYYLNDKVILGNDPIKGEGQLLIRFEVLDLLDIKPENILSAEYIISEISNTKTTATIAMYPVISEWCSLNTRWKNKPQLANQFVQRVSVNKSGDYQLDVTEPIKLWLKNKGGETEYIIRHGFTLVNETPENPKLFATGDNGMFTTCLKITLKEPKN